MSTTITESELESQDVMVRAFQDEPVRLRAIGRTDGAIEVVGSDKTKSIGFPAECVYRLDAGLFKKLNAAFHDRKAELLARLWEKAEPI